MRAVFIRNAFRVDIGHVAMAATAGRQCKKSTEMLEATLVSGGQPGLWAPGQLPPGRIKAGLGKPVCVLRMESLLELYLVCMSAWEIHLSLRVGRVVCAPWVGTVR